jgi:hypothetical protein
MLVLSVGMPRAGSGWYYNLNHDLLVSAGYQDVHEIRRRYHLEKILTEVNSNIGALTTRRLLLVLLPAFLGKTFAIKAHASPRLLALFFIRLGMIRPTYIYRDPRDAMLSAFENGQRARQNGRENAFSHLKTFEITLDFMREYVRIWEQWMACSQALHARYEDLLINYDDQAAHLVDFLGLKMTPTIQVVLDRYRPEQAQSTDQQGLHFRKGKIGCFRQVFTAEQQQACIEAFGLYLGRMGYDL